MVSVARLGETSDDDEGEDTEEAGETGEEAGVEPSDDSAAEPQAGDE